MSNIGPHNSASFQRYDSEFYYIKNFILGSVNQSCTGVCLAINSFSSIMLCLVFKSMFIIHKALNRHKTAHSKLILKIHTCFVFWKIESAFGKIELLEQNRSNLFTMFLHSHSATTSVCEFVFHTLFVLIFYVPVNIFSVIVGGFPGL